MIHFYSENNSVQFRSPLLAPKLLTRSLGRELLSNRRKSLQTRHPCHFYHIQCIKLFQLPRSNGIQNGSLFCKNFC
uniref:Uncharacterized protein n=1 Tax=Anguilla anguilla TaxID=7936 RepID=A0A0E9SY58_ANGAN